MSDLEKKVDNGNSSVDEITVGAAAAKTAAAKKKKDAKKAERNSNFFKDVAAEFKKIIWPNRNALGKRTVAVLVSSVLLGAIIFLIDMIIHFGLDKLIK